MLCSVLDTVKTKNERASPLSSVKLGEKNLRVKCKFPGWGYRYYNRDGREFCSWQNSGQEDLPFHLLGVRTVFRVVLGPSVK